MKFMHCIIFVIILDHFLRIKSFFADKSAPTVFAISLEGSSVRCGRPGTSFHNLLVQVGGAHPTYLFPEGRSEFIREIML